jgi:hypothetical protein
MRLVISASLIVFVCLPIALRAQISSLEALYKTHQYFALRDQVNRRTDDRSPDFLFYRGVVANRFNRLEESIRYLTTYGENKNLRKLATRTRSWPTITSKLTVTRRRPRCTRHN